MKKSLRLISLLFCVMLICTVSVSAEKSTKSAEPSYDSYTYWEELSSGSSKQSIRTKPLYQFSRTLESVDLGYDAADKLSDVYCSEAGYIYILEAEKPSITVLDKDYSIVKRITELTDSSGSSVSFKGATGLYVTKNEEIYLCGTASACVWKTDTNGVIEKTLYIPKSDIIPDDFKYAPIKVTVDSKGYVYVLSDGSYYGAIIYSPNGEFLGFYGANTVKSGALQVLSNIWNKLFVNDVKKAASVKSLPYQFTDFDMGYNDFIYTTTGRTGNSSEGQVQILNPSGKDILGATSYDFDDTETAKISKYGWIVQDTSQIAADGEFLYLLDTSQGKIFMYDFEGNIIGEFGRSMGKASGQKDALSKPAAITCNDDEVIIVDNGKKSLVVFSLTEYGRLVKNSQRLTLKSKYNDAADGWKEVLKQDKNSQLAYRGLARAALRNSDYENAMALAKKGAARDIYSEAYSVYRNQWIKANSALVFAVIIVFILAVIFSVVFFKRKRITLFSDGDNKISHFFYTLLHPFDGFGSVIAKGNGSVAVGGALMVLLYVSAVLKATKSGFAYSYFNPDTYNSLFTLVKTVGIVVLWTLVNWAVGVLFGGLGKIRNIFIVITYSFAPLIVSNILYTVLSNVMLESEAGFLNIMVTLFWIYTLFLIVAGTVKIQDFSFGRFVGTSVLTVIGILIVIFLVFCIFLLMQQCVMFFGTIVNEIIYR